MRRHDRGEHGDTLRSAQSEVLQGTPADLPQWMALVRRLRRSFPGLETEEALAEHALLVARFMQEGRALCTKSEGRITGVILFSRRHNQICCLGVDPAHRRGGLASALMHAALEQMDTASDISVSTFRDGDPKGTAPRALYRSLGFEPAELVTELNYPCQRFVLRAPRDVE